VSEAALPSPPPETDEGTKAVDAAQRLARERATLLAGGLPPVSLGCLALDLAAWRCRGGLAGLSLALEGANGGACSVIALLVAVVPGQGGERCAQIFSGAAPFLLQGVAWGVGVVLQGCGCDCCCCLLAIARR
jgi:hypothetical protein